MSFPETFLMLGEPPEMLIGSAMYEPKPERRCHLRLCIVCQRPAQKFDVGVGPWCSDLCQTRGRCPVCGLPPADYEGHWCATAAGMVWRRWEQ